MNQTLLFNHDWSFQKTPLHTTTVTQEHFKPVDIPHDWLIYNSQALYEDSIGWYQKTLTITDLSKSYALYFEGVYMDSMLYVNDKLVGEWKYGYSSFEFDMTDFLVEGDNNLLLKVTHQAPNSRWYSGAGIYRDVYLKVRGTAFIETDGTYVTTEKNGNDYQLTIDTTIETTHPVTVRCTLTGHGEASVIEATDQSTGTTSQTLTVLSPKEWSHRDPALYTLTTELLTDQQVVLERYRERIGFRTFQLEPNRGFIVNGQQVKINGTCEHHDLGALGAAFNKEAMRYRLELLKDMGVNGIRTAHNMPAKGLMDLCDEMGFYVVSEAFDMWERTKTPYDYGRFFNDWVHRDVASWIKRDRNHPSVVMWSIGNEIYDTHASNRGVELTEMLRALVETYDPKGNARVTIGSNYMPWEHAKACADVVKVAGYNYAEKYYDQHHKKYPDWIIYGSETASVVQSRGIYHFPYDTNILSDDDQQCSALGNSTTSWGAKSPEACIIAERDTPYSVGQFLWTGFDYIGEPTPYHTKNAYFGQLDTATFKKDSYYIYQAGWMDVKTNPIVHIFPYWDFNPGQLIDVRVASNAPRVELFINGESLGQKAIDHQHGTVLVPTYQVRYEPGELKAVAYDETGHVIATDNQQSFNDPVLLVIETNKQTLTHSEDLVFVTIKALDEFGREVKNATNRIYVDVSGAGRLVGLDNGDSTDYDTYKGKSKRLFSGKLMAIIQPKQTRGKVMINVSSIGLTKATETIDVMCPRDQTIGVVAENSDQMIVTGKRDEVTVRKITLDSHGIHQLTHAQPSVDVSVTLSPEYATDKAIAYKIVTDEGAETTRGAVEETPQGVRVTAKGDGNFRLRAMSKDHTNAVRLISELDFTATGLGQFYKDPYQFIAGSLYDDATGDVGSGNDRGFATSNDERCLVGFHDLDFKDRGADTVTLPIFTLNDDVYTLKIWDCHPDEGATLLLDDTYQKPSIWNVYQSETYRLNKRLTNIQSLYIETANKMHVKGFQFEPFNRANRTVDVTTVDTLYGDHYTLEEDKISQIGNNVSLTFNDFDFGEAGANRLVINGHSPIDKNTVHVRFSDGEVEMNQLIEFTETDTLTEKVFELESVYGKQSVTFIFLPGSQFDFASFKLTRK
ncbi:hypothetical protein HMI01_22470 [Halolactibacillus miurensis]|uniref:Beta-galactosidase n=1 Tax=Halolactibacillus miurensis TaxID=306541 RepID=A0A1I6UGW3_9BACI|nr:glycoside hydrolase family 2 TIM barrel-domain containing protein [Halolactibacillus miurensis]GEM05259.1 hypothetical protein HMI01_22470 [Halolactibacillus miurensis]SFT00729.1 beta-galactosidase [Halolactibacillus miurensis]